MTPSVLLLALAGAPQSPAPEAFVERRVALAVQIDYDAPRLTGSITYELENWTDRPAGTVSFILNRLMEISGVRSAASGRDLSFSQDVRRFSDDPMRQVTQVIVQLPAAILPRARTTQSPTTHARFLLRRVGPRAESPCRRDRRCRNAHPAR